jgi:CheY-like chemotaxis protein
VNKAIEIYLEHAYEDEVLRAAHGVRFDEAMPIGEVLDNFEREESKLPAFSYRLGSQHYPHMKLAIWEAYYEGEFIFAVDRHDGFDFDKTGPDYDSWLGIKSHNHQAKVAIEDAWYQEKIPTLRRLKEERMSQSDIMRAFSGHTVMLVDNDGDAGAIMEMILSNAGYGCRWMGSVAQSLELIKTGDIRCGLAVIDLMLSDGSGLDVVKALRASAATQDIPILLTSAMNGSDVMMADIDGYLRKPFSAKALLDTVAQTIKRCYDGHDRLLEPKT